jgi:hypothetical protein
VGTEIQKTPLYNELMDVYEKCDKNTNVYYTAQVICTEFVYDPIEVVSFMVQRDYADNYADETSITLKITLGKYAYKIYPNRTKLKICVKKFSLGENGEKLIDAKVPATVYSAVLLEERPAPVQLQGNEAKSEEALDVQDVWDVKFQLFNNVLEYLKNTQIGAVGRNTTVENLIRNRLVSVNETLKLGKEKAVDTFQVQPATNQQQIDAILVPQGVSIIDLPGYVQQRYGVYSADIGSYVQGRCWYVYSLFDTGRYQQSKNTLTIYILPTNKFPEIERTYRRLGDSIAVLSVSKSEFGKDNDINYIVSGNGVRYADAGIVMESYTANEGNKAVADRSMNASEYIASKQGSGLTNAPVSQDKLTSNPYVEFSKLARRKGGIFKVVWINSDPDSLIPGMAMRAVYLVGDTLQEAYGVLIGATHMAIKAGSIGSEKHTVNSMLYFFSNLNASGTQ